MTDMVERYIHQVGRYLPQKERADIEAELRSQIRDKVEDRFGGAATPDDVASVLLELGHPRQMAASYSGEQYLIGPTLYPIMLMVLRRGLMIIPIIVVIVRAVAAVFSNEEITLIRLALETVGGVIQAMAIFAGIVVLIFALIERSGESIDEFTGEDKGFDPAKLPEVEDPTGFDRFEAIFGVAAGVFGIFILLYFLRVGGLTFWFDLGGPAEIIPAPIPWIILLILNTAGLVLMNVVALRRNGWTVGTLLVDTLLEAFGAVCFYFAVILPLFDYALVEFPGLANIPLIERAPQAFFLFSIIIALASGAGKIIKLWGNRRHGEPSYHVKAGS